MWRLLLALCLMTSAAAQQARTKTTQHASQHTAPSPRWLTAISSRADYDQLARTYYQGRFYALPHLMFVIDRAASNSKDQPKVYFVNSKRYSFHAEFVHANYLTLERGREFFRHNYVEASRRFLMGTIACQKSGQFTFEFQEVDQVTPELVREAYAKLSRSFFAPLHFKPNSARQEQIAAQLADVPQLRADELSQPGSYMPLNQARNLGVLRILDRVTDDTIIDRNEIIIFREAPLTLTPLSGIITTRLATPLAHVNLLAKGWGIPNAYIRDADEIFKPLAGKFVYFETREDGFTLRPAETRETAEYGHRMAERSDLITPRADLEYKKLTELKDQRRTDAVRFGAKAANLGEVMHAIRAGMVTGVTVPPGFSIPFYYYDQFISENKLDDEITEMLGNDRFNHDPAYRKKRLAELRDKIQRGRVNAEFERAVTAKAHAMFGAKGVFARSSTNAEDLPDFSGAGLYTSVPNVRGETALVEAIKTVWASLWNYEAYEARESAGLNHAAVYASVLIQEGMNADAAGVLITTNIFDDEDRGAVYLNAKRGLGIRVVEGRRVPEQVIYHPRSGAIRVLTRSGDDTMLTFDERGGVREVKIENARAVLTDAMVRRLGRAAMQIKRAFRDRDQDIEWLTVGPELFIVQSRPYVKGQ
ncbi:MAG TPA: PEP/pyruvate-binding domain-containing protein [Blastocatellia bacterium]|nr:PEP/pyruvate-binding domain-containing protein [Blastocatellia bacterium]